jgi:peptidyl-tRNA hydrolase, PTH1 family
MSDRWLIVGLGNPGPEYEKTRHNVGFMTISELAEANGIKGQQEKKFNALIGSGSIEGFSVLLSGETVRKLMDYYKIPPEQLLVIYDDTALPVGKIRLRAEGSAGGQNGMKSIIQHLGGNQTFPRLRIGIGTPPPQWSMADYVLSRFSAEEMDWMEKSILPEVQKAIVLWIKEGVSKAATRFNGMKLIPEPLASENP